MENKENSRDSANSTSSEEIFNKKELTVTTPCDKKASKTENKPDEYESSTQDLSLRLELDESASLKETQDEYRMFSRIESPEGKKHVFHCDKETQEFQMSRSMDGPQSNTSSENIKETHNPDENIESAITPEIEKSEQIDPTLRSSVKRQLDSQDSTQDAFEILQTKKQIKFDNDNDESDLFNTSDEGKSITKVLESDEEMNTDIENDSENHGIQQTGNSSLLDQTEPLALSSDSTQECEAPIRVTLPNNVVYSANQIQSNKTSENIEKVDDTTSKVVINELTMSKAEKEVPKLQTNTYVDGTSENIKTCESGNDSNDVVKPSESSLFVKASDIRTKVVSNVSDSGSDIPIENHFLDGPAHDNSTNTNSTDFTLIKKQSTSNSSISPPTTPINKINDAKCVKYQVYENNAPKDCKVTKKTHVSDKVDFKTPECLTSKVKMYYIKESDLSALKMKLPEEYFVELLKVLKEDKTKSHVVRKDLRRISEISSISSNSKSSSSTGYLGDMERTSSSDAPSPELQNQDLGDNTGQPLSVLTEINESNDEIEVVEEETFLACTYRARKNEATLDNDLLHVETQKILPRETLNNSDLHTSFNSKERVKEMITIKTRGKRKLPKEKRKNSITEFKQSVQSQEVPLQPSLDISLDSINESAHRLLNKPSLNVGDQVFAKWIQQNDTRYYPGIITKVERLDEITQDEEDVKFYVVFEDGFEKGGLKWDDMIPVSLLEEGHAVSVDCPDYENAFCLAKLSAYPEFIEDNSSDNENNTKMDVMYTVDYEKTKKGYASPKYETERISYKRITLDKDQVCSIKTSLGGCWSKSLSSNCNMDMSLNNVISGKRRSRLASVRKSSPALKTPQKNNKVMSETSSGEEILRGRNSSVIRSRSIDREVKYSNIIESPAGSLSSSKRRKIKKGGDNVETSLSESKTDDGLTNKLSRKTHSRSRKELLPTDGNSLANTSNSLNELFCGIQFILTKGSRSQELENNSDIYSSSEIEMEKQENSDSLKTIFHRKQIKEIIESNGGVVLQEIPSISSVASQANGTPSKVPHIIVLSDQYCQTMSFLLGIGYGYKRLSFKWIIDSQKKGKLVSMEQYYLPSGWSITEDRIVQQNETLKGEKSKNGIFDKLHILLSSRVTNFTTDWKALLARLGAKVSCRENGSIDRSMRGVDVVVVDESNVSESILEDAIEHSIPIVTAMWIIQSLINKQRVPYEKFLFFN